MARRRSVSVPTLELVVPTAEQRFVALTDREKKLALLSRAHRHVSMRLKIGDYERVLSLAEQYEEDLSVVLRAALMHGVAHLEQWASKAPGAQPFAGGLMVPRPLSRIDPSGLLNPPPSRVFQNPQGFTPPATMPYRQEYVGTPVSENVWDAPPPRRASAPPGVLPSGATVNPPAPQAPVNMHQPHLEEELLT